jgi:DNA topoisomerase-2
MHLKTVEEKFVKLDEISHVLLRPGRYIGSISPHTASTYVVSEDLTKMVKEDITWCPGLQKIFDEVISNSVDFSKTADGSHVTTIKVDINRQSGEIVVEDNGGIVVVKHSGHDQYIPEMIFELRAGSNFNDEDDSVLTGQNGEGAALTSIFSTSFHVRTSDGKHQFDQYHLENSRKKTDPKIKASDKHFTKITFTPDYPKFNLTGLDEGNYKKLVKRVYDVAGCNPKLKVYLNGTHIKIKSFEDYIKFYTEEYVYDENDNWKVGVAHSDDGFKHVSFVNGTETSIGGFHVNYIIDQITDKLREHINKKSKIDVKPSDIRSHIQLFINSTIIRPRYNSQTKEDLTTEIKNFGTTFDVTDKFIAKVIKSPIIESILLWVEAKAKAEEMRQLRELNKDIAKSDPRRVEKFSDALEDDRRDLCELLISEGDSARKSIHEARGKNPYIGSFALKGKPLNVMDVDLKKILGGKDKDDNGNVEIKNILKITGLKFGEKVKSANDLRFGKIITLTDADLDGHHISSLLINFFAYFWPELFELGIIYRMNTPLVIATMGAKELEFFDDDEYERWAKTGPKHVASRFKGLGKFKTPRFKKILENRDKYLVRIEPLEVNDVASISLAFKGSMADERKEWLSDINYFNNFE